jgi:hypothetical protein
MTLGTAALCWSCGILLKLPDATSEGDEAVGLGGDGSGGDSDAIDQRSGGGSQLTSSGGVGGETTSAAGGMAEQGSGGSGLGGALPDGCLKHCDCDDDGAMTEGACGGDDCDDEDPLVFPGQTKFFSVRAKNDQIGFDYDCSGVIERPAAQSTKLNCKGLELFDCEEGQGFFDALPSCGNTGEWGSCEKDTLSCEDDVIDEAAVALCH